MIHSSFLRHKSKFSNSVRVETKQHKTTTRTMGAAKVSINDPKDFLKKHSRDMPPREGKPFKYSEEKRRPPVPPHTEKPQMATPTKKDFVRTNVTSNVMSVPKKPNPVYVDTSTGAKHLLEPSGLVPMYTHKKDFGKVPDYLTQRKQEMEEAQEAYDRYVQQSFERGAMGVLSEDERSRILQGLKKNWEELHHQYQGLSVVTDTAPKKARKERMEAEMKQLEKDIEVIEKHSVIYVSQE